MLALITILGMVIISPPGEIKAFSQHSNGVAAYEFIKLKPCETGVRRSGYTYSPIGGSVVLKQKNPDGTVTIPACVN
jgi:hypothetical protein